MRGTVPTWSRDSGKNWKDRVREVPEDRPLAEATCTLRSHGHCKWTTGNNAVCGLHHFLITGHHYLITATVLFLRPHANETPAD